MIDGNSKINWLAVCLVAVVALLVVVTYLGLSRFERFSEGIKMSDGVHRTFHPDGTLRGEWNYRNDKLDGKGLEYYQNGQVKYEDWWVSGDLVWRRTYDSNGVLVDEFGEETNANLR